ncbi:homocysteine-responsive endoplasmic reticulum-resident ubiquitin-like domain member 2 protein [Anneissia japonica]|uniref:homocysteine-responsive endoplasmic reticulum-resident ubiquitin-like domain member 2 protein n=1 Tax=Anneissia japonica TaxID=1529436 RepID=UPI0014255961|nr:homocysteine-responsive endoplasmic reticulum-resident ubiquitin-like domain member 2 protein [Anneissia japonica]
MNEGAQITVVVRAPDQTSSDFVMECSELWTVKNMKAYISKSYPSKPDEKHQKIIYSGKLLSDNTVLKDIFRVQEDKRHTVHLVCLQQTSSTKSHSFTAPIPSTLPHSATGHSSSSNTSGGVNDSQNNSDGLRQRHGANSSFNPYYAYNNYGGYQMQYGGNIPSSSYYQAYWMQQYYAQQMAQYAQYSNQQLTTPNPLNANVNPPPVVNLAAQPVANVNIANNAQPNQNNVRMNAGVGPAIDDDDDDQGNRDWLDWSYMFFRATVLISIVYFYSSMNRFMIVIGFIAFFYMYRQRQLSRQRQLAAEEVAVAAEEERPADQVDGQQQQQQESDNLSANQQEGQQGEGSNMETQENSEGDATTAPSPPGPGVFSTAWIFFSSFFTSLIPHEPPAANVN